MQFKKDEFRVIFQKYNDNHTAVAGVLFSPLTGEDDFGLVLGDALHRVSPLAGQLAGRLSALNPFMRRNKIKG